MLRLSLAALLSCATATNAGPQVKLDFGTFEGISDPTTGVDTFYGLPFAAPPVGKLRLRPPQPFNTSFGAVVQNASVPTFDCMNQPVQPGSENATLGWIALTDGWPLMGNSAPESEDCLYLNVYRPSTANRTSKLPVMVWIYGGGFETGGISGYDGTPLVAKSIALGKDVISVAANYRLSGWGFMPGQEMQDAGLGNIGLLDQRAALLWIQKHISAFGGDPEQVMIFGDSAGAMSVSFQQVMYGGDSQGTFRGAIMHSGSMLPLGMLSDAQWVFDNRTSAVGCGSAADKIECLRGVNNTLFALAVGNLPGTLSGHNLQEDLAFAPRVDGITVPDTAEMLYRGGRFTKVPVIIGACEDDGSIFQFSNYDVTTDADFKQYLQEFASLSNSTVDALLQQYPSDPAAGVPYGSGNLYNVTGQNKRLASFFGDVAFVAPRRFLGTIYRTSHLPLWSFLYSHSANIPFLGAFHGSDVAASVLGLKPDAIAEQMQRMWIGLPIRWIRMNMRGTSARRAGRGTSVLGDR